MRGLVLSIAVVGCHSYDGLLEPPPTSEGRQFAIQVTVPPGEETTVCRNFAMPDGTFDIGRFETAMTPISHHLLVYNLNLASSQVTDEVIAHCDEDPDVQDTRVGLALLFVRSGNAVIQVNRTTGTPRAAAASLPGVIAVARVILAALPRA